MAEDEDELQAFNSPWHDLRATWAGPFEPIESQMARADHPLPNSLEGVDRARALLGASEACVLDWRPEVRQIGLEIVYWLRDGRGTSLDRWLGITEIGRGSMWEAIAIHERNALLRQIAKGEPYRNMSTTSVAGLLRQRWVRWTNSPRLEKDPETRAFARLTALGYDPLHRETIRKALVRE